MSNREAYEIKSAADKKRCVCIDSKNEADIMAFLREDPVRVSKFREVIDLILSGQRNSEVYSKENIDKKCKDVTAIKMFKGGQNIRLYCKEQKSDNGTFYVIVAKHLPKKKDQKVKGKTKTLIQTVSSYDYTIVERK